jgi:hypothetical protein
MFIVDEAKKSSLFSTLYGNWERFAGRRRCAASFVSIVFTTYSRRINARTKASMNGRQKRFFAGAVRMR